MCTGEMQEMIIGHASGEIREYTGVPAYDLTYEHLCDAGERLRKGIATRDAEQTATSARGLIVGLVAWNQQSQVPQDDQVPLAQLASSRFPEDADQLVQVVKNYENLGVDAPPQSPLGEARRVLGVDTGLAFASKLLHFLSPGYLPIMDSNVLAALNVHPQPGQQGDECYNNYAACLRALGITAHEPDNPHECVAAFGDSTVAPKRRARSVDCTLWFRREPARL